MSNLDYKFSYRRKLPHIQPPGATQTQYGGEQGELHVVKLLEDATGVSLQPGEQTT